MTRVISRRAVVGTLASGTLLAGCGRLDNTAPANALLQLSDGLTLRAQRLLLSQRPLVRELAAADISTHFPTNGTVLPTGDYYQRLLENDFKDWKLKVHGLVERPLAWSLEELRAMPSRTQITMHNCDEGWSAIGQWTGVQLGRVLQEAELAPEARYVVFHCIDELVRTPDRSGFYYESLDLFDALHPQTILAYGMNGNPLPVRHGAPLRLRVERQVGYKHAKYLTRIEAVERLDRIGKGRGGFWEDRGYQWYAGL